MGGGGGWKKILDQPSDPDLHQNVIVSSLTYQISGQ